MLRPICKLKMPLSKMLVKNNLLIAFFMCRTSLNDTTGHGLLFGFFVEVLKYCAGAALIFVI